MKREINVWEYAGAILEPLGKGVLMTTKADGITDTMTIGWGTLGIEWGKPIFVGYVRESRYTREMLDQNGEFTVNVPMGEIDSKILGFCGTKSGRDVDKIKEMNLTLEDPEVISVPGFRELPLTLECKVLFKNKQDEARLPQDIRDRYYSGGKNTGDVHYAYYAEIVSAYIIA